MKKDTLWYRMRGIDKMEARFGNKLIQRFIQQRLAIEDVVRVLELGFGEGKCLLELRALFPDRRVELYGINNVKKGDMSKRGDFAANAERFGVSVKRPLPKPFFYDAGEGLHFEDSFFDVIISQVAIHYVGDKAKLLEEMWRTLKLGGKAFLHVDAPPNERSPDFMMINPQTPRFLIYDGDRLVKLGSYLRKMKGHDILRKRAVDKPEQSIILMTKNTKRALNLGLEYDGNSTLDLTKLKGSDSYKTEPGIWWGTRSVFRVK